MTYREEHEDLPSLNGEEKKFVPRKEVRIGSLAYTENMMKRIMGGHSKLPLIEFKEANGLEGETDEFYGNKIQPDKLLIKLDEYFTLCIDRNRPPTFPGMLAYLDISKKTKNKYCLERVYQEIFDVAAVKMEAIISELALMKVVDSKVAVAALKNFHEWEDKKIVESDSSDKKNALTVNIILPPSLGSKAILTEDGNIIEGEVVEQQPLNQEKKDEVDSTYIDDILAEEEIEDEDEDIDQEIYEEDLEELGDLEKFMREESLEIGE